MVDVVALTSPAHDQYTDPLLAYVEAALQVIAHDGRIGFTQINAWLPDGAHQPHLVAAYIRRGWTCLEPTWWAALHRAQLRRTYLTQLLQTAPLSGTAIHALDALNATSFQLATRLNHLRQSHQVQDVYCAVQGDQVVAVNAVELDDRYGAVLTTSAFWQPGLSPAEDVDQALAATVLSHRRTLPDLLIGTGDIAPYQAWFSGVLDVEFRDGFTLTVDASRPPTHWEFAMGFNPRRIWLVPPVR